MVVAERERDSQRVNEGGSDLICLGNVQKMLKIFVIRSLSRLSFRRTATDTKRNMFVDQQMNPHHSHPTHTHTHTVVLYACTTNLTSTSTSAHHNPHSPIDCIVELGRQLILLHVGIALTWKTHTHSLTQTQTRPGPQRSAFVFSFYMFTSQCI